MGFLVSYWESLSRHSDASLSFDSKGKQPASSSSDHAPQRRPQAPAGGTWSPPPPDWTKINIDGSVVVQTGQAGVGVICRDSNGQVVFSAWQAYNRCCDTPETEALACVGLQKAVQGGLSRIIIEMNCAPMYSAMGSDIRDWSEIGYIIDEAKDLTGILYEWKISQVERERESNQVANILAAFTRRTNS